MATTGFRSAVSLQKGYPVTRLQACIIGAQKSASTALMQYVKQHPDVRGQAFHEFRYVGTEDAFKIPWRQAIDDEFDAESQGSVLVAKHALAMNSDEILARLQSLNPSLRLIVVLRDPVARAYSAYWWARVAGYQNPNVSFAEAIAPLFAGEASRDLATDYIGNSMYASAIQRVWRFFPQDQLLVVFDDDLRVNPEAVLEKVFTHIGLNATKSIEPLKVHTAARAKSAWLASLLKAPPPMLRRLARRWISNRTRRGIFFRLAEWNREPFSPPDMPLDVRRNLEDLFLESDTMLEGLLKQRLPWRATGS